MKKKKYSSTSHRINIQKTQNPCLIWLDSSINKSNVDCCNTFTQLQRVMHSVTTYTDDEECVRFLKNMRNEKVCMIISGALGQHIVPQIHHLTQVTGIFIFCENKEYHQAWATHWHKIKGVFTEITHICNALKDSVHQHKQESISRNSTVTHGGISNRRLDKIKPSFMYIMKFFINDLDRQIDQLHEGHFGGIQSNSKFIVYRGQYATKMEFDKLQQTKGGLLAFNNFLTTSRSDQTQNKLLFIKHSIFGKTHQDILEDAETPICQVKDKQEHIIFHEKTLEIPQNYFLKIILIWLHFTTIFIECMTTWVNMLNGFPIRKNHFLPIILISQ